MTEPLVHFLVEALLAIRDGNRSRAIERCSAAMADPDALLPAALHTALTVADRDDVYDAPAAFQAFIDGGSNRSLYDATIAAIRAEHRSLGTRALLDIGCGDGRVAHGVAPATCIRLDLIEPSADLLAQAVARCAVGGLPVVEHQGTLADARQELDATRWDAAQSTFALHTIPPAERVEQLGWVRARTDALLVAEFDVPGFGDRSEGHARYAVDRYERGLREYAGDGGLVAQGFLMPVLIAQFDPDRERLTFEQPATAWIDQLRAAGFTDVRTTALYDYWWAPAQLFVAT